MAAAFYLTSWRPRRPGRCTPLPPLLCLSHPEAVRLHPFSVRTSFSEELADRSTSWASKNSETDSDMDSRLSLEACWVNGIPICSPACRGRGKTTRSGTQRDAAVTVWEEAKPATTSRRHSAASSHPLRFGHYGYEQSIDPWKPTCRRTLRRRSIY